MITTYHNISFGTQTVPEQIPVVQGDTGREIVFILTDFTIPEGATATYYVQKPSGEAVYNNAAISNNQIIVALTAQSIIEVGENNMQVRIILGDAIVTSFRVILMVRPFLGIGAVESTTEMNIFDEAVETAKEEIEAAGEAAAAEVAEGIDPTLTISGKAADAKVTGDEITALKADISDLSETALSAYVTDTATGAIASFPDGADGVPVKSLTVEIDPVQDLHGQSSPYPAGGGKNLAEIALTSYTGNGVTFTKNADGSFNLNGTATASFNIRYDQYNGDSDNLKAYDAGQYTVNTGTNKFYFQLMQYGSYTVIFNNNGSASAVTATVNNRYEDCFQYIRIESGTSFSNETFKIMFEEGPSASTWTPYSNICPITGWSEAKVADAQRYVLLRPDAPQTYTKHGVTWDASRFPFITAKGTASGGTSYSETIGGRSQDNSLTAGTYTFKVVGDVDNANVIFQVGSGSVQALNKNTTEITVTVTETTSVSWYCNVGNETAVDAKFAFVIGDANIYTIDLDGTRYGGTLDVTSGVLTVENGYTNLTGGFSRSSGGVFFIDDTASDGISAEVMSNMFAYGGNVTGAEGAKMHEGELCTQDVSGHGLRILLYDTSYASVSDFNTFLSSHSLQIVYKLATPLTVQLTAEEVTTLLGQNNIFADCGDVSCEYRADTKLYIEKILNA